jgi:hypothetical protein
MPSQPLPQIERVTEAELRRLFNENYLPRIQAGEITTVVLRGANKHPSPILAHEPFCTESQEVSYRDPVTGQELARAHRYLRRDGTIGASGFPDPKRVYLNGILYRIIKQKHRS